MVRAVAFGLVVLACACAPAPASMSAGEASERLARFAASPADDACTPQGRAMLREAVRVYGAAMEEAGVAWPELPGRRRRGAA